MTTAPTVRTTLRLLGNVLVGATLLRLYGLSDYSLWLDEGATWTWATKPTLAEAATADPNHPPVWWLVTRAGLAFFPDDEWGLRLPAADRIVSA